MDQGIGEVMNVLEGKRFIETTVNRIPTGESGDGGIVLAGAEVVLVDFGVVPLACEAPGVGRGIGGGNIVDRFAVGGICIGAFDITGRIGHEANTAKAIMEVVVPAHGRYGSAEGGMIPTVKNFPDFIEIPTGISEVGLVGILSSKQAGQAGSTAGTDGVAV